jgi:hypothetical protein
MNNTKKALIAIVAVFALIALNVATSYADKQCLTNKTEQP